MHTSRPFKLAPAHTLALPLALALAPAAFALEWDTDGTTPGAQGATVSPAAWSTTDNHWWDGFANVTWSNVTSLPIVFGGTPGVVQIVGGVTARDIAFTTGNFSPPASSFTGAYEIKGATTNNQPLLLSTNASLGDYPDISVASAVRGIFSFTHTNTGFSTGAGFTKHGAGTLIIQHNTAQATSQIAGTITVAAGRLIFDSLMPTTLANASVVPNQSSPIIVQSGATLQLDRSHALGGNPDTSLRKVRLESGSSLLLANARQYFSEIDVFDASIASTTRETTSAGTDENEAPALLTPVGGLTLRARAPAFDRFLAMPIEVREGPLTLIIEDGAPSYDYSFNGQIQSPTGATHDVIKNGPGTLRFNASNTFAGNFLINSGLVWINASGALGIATTGGHGEVRVQSGAAIELNGIAQTFN